MAKTKFKNIVFLRIVRKIITISGFFFIVCTLVSLTSWPFWGYYWLGTSKSEISREPTQIILLGGGGMPSESNLMRSWYTAQAAKKFPESEVIIAMPGNLTDSLSTPQLMKKELEIRGVKNQILFEPLGTNTRSQALNCKRIIKMQSSVLLISSPEHMRRAVMCFEKAGFEKINALPAFENAVEADLRFNDDELGGNTVFVPDVGNNINMRYQLWNHLKYEILIAREMVALTYYWIRGWI